MTASRWATRFILPVALVFLLSVGSVAKTTITHFAYTGHGDAYYEFILNAKALFEAANPDVEINVVRGANYDQAITMIAGGVAPDVLDLSTNVAPGFFAAGFLADLTPFLERDGEFDEGDFIPLAMAGYRTEEAVFGLPTSTFQIFTFYNKDLFGEAGYPDPNQLGDDWTWETAVDAARKITRDTSGDGNPDRWGVVASNSLYRWPIFVHQAGAYLFDRIVNPTRPAFESEAARQGLGFFADLYRTHNVVAPTYMEFLKGEAGFTLDTGPSQFGLIEREAAGAFAWDVVQLPKGPNNNGTMVIMNGYQMGSATAHPEEAWRWLKFLASEAMVDDFMRRTGRTPARISAWRNYAATLAVVPEHLDAVSDAIMNPHSTTNYITPIYSALASASASIVAPVLRGEKSVEQALQELNLRAQALFAERESQ